MLLIELNDDCLELIFIKLSLVRQIAVKNTCSRLQQVILFIWHSPSHNKIVKLLRLDVWHFGTNMYNDILTYMDSICNVVEDLEFGNIHIKQLRSLKNLKFPKVLTLNCKMEPGGSDRETCALMAKLFPALTSLKLMSTLSGKYLWYMKHLVDLDISDCKHLKSDNLHGIISRLKLRRLTLHYSHWARIKADIPAVIACSTLEELIINGNNMFPYCVYR